MSEKTEKPTAKKLKDARKKGEIPKSQKLPIFGGLLGGIVGMNLVQSFAYEKVADTMRLMFDVGNALQLSPKEAIVSVVTAFFAISLPISIGTIIGTVLATMIQTQGLVTFESLKPKPESLLGISYFKRFGTPQPVYDALLMMAYIIVLVFLGYIIFKSYFTVWVKAYGVHYAVLGYSVFEAIMSVFKQMAMLALVIVIFDFVYQWQQFMKKQKMSKDDLKREYKEQEGDPMIKGIRKSIAREIANSPMKKPVLQSASMVLTNPTHIAVILLHDREHRVPIVIGYGLDEEVPKIRATCKRLGIPVYEDKPLARLIYGTTGVGALIPRETYDDVAKWIAKAKLQRDAFYASNARQDTPVSRPAQERNDAKNNPTRANRPNSPFGPGRLSSIAKRLFAKLPKRSFWRKPS